VVGPAAAAGPDGGAPALPRLDVGRVLALRDRLWDALADVVGLTVDGEACRFVAGRLAPLAAGTAGPSALLESALADSVRALLGQELLAQPAWDLCWRLAGNVAALRRGLPAAPWTRPLAAEWVPLEFLHGRSYARPSKGRDRPGWLYQGVVLAGTPAGVPFAGFWSRELVGFWSGRFGFSAPWGKRPRKDGLELVGLRVWGLTGPDAKPGLRGPGFTKYEVTSGFAAYNKAVMDRRHRRGFACPFGYRHDCCRCPKGRDACPAACRPLSLVALDRCARCGQAPCWQDPWLGPEPECLRCRGRPRPPAAPPPTPPPPPEDSPA
jgi:hypothetical protein